MHAGLLNAAKCSHSCMYAWSCLMNRAADKLMPFDMTRRTLRQHLMCSGDCCSDRCRVLCLLCRRLLILLVLLWHWSGSQARGSETRSPLYYPASHCGAQWGRLPQSQ